MLPGSPSTGPTRFLRALEPDYGCPGRSVRARPVPVLTPQAVDRGRRFPHFQNLALTSSSCLRMTSGTRYARSNSRVLPRFVPIPTRTGAHRGATEARVVRLAWYRRGGCGASAASLPVPMSSPPIRSSHP
jgi:hypothetical protein